MQSQADLMLQFTAQILESLNNLAISNQILAKSLDNFTNKITDLNHKIDDITSYAKQMGAVNGIGSMLGQFINPNRR